MTTKQNTRNQQRRFGPTALIVAGVAALSTLSLLIAFGPRPIALATQRTGEEEISTLLESGADPGSNELAAFVSEDGEVRFGGLGADENTEFEIGSLTKTFNGELARQQIEAGTLRLDTQVQDIIDAAGTPIADVTVEELLNHTSGLSRLESIGLPQFLSMMVRDGGNPYRGDTPEDIFTAATNPKLKLKGRGEENYSNFGHALLGQLLAKNAGMSYDELLRTKILEPAGMTSTFLALPGTADGHPQGLTLAGRPAERWEMNGWAPAGAIRSTAKDIAKYVDWISAHGGPDLGWAELEDDGTAYTFHNGGTGGYSTMLVWDPANPRRAAFVANSSEASVDDLGIKLLKGTQR